MNALLPNTSKLPQSMEGVNGLNLYGKSTPSSILVKNKYLKIMQTRATLALKLPCIWTIYKLKNTDLLFCSLSFFFFSPLKCLCPFTISPISIQPPRQGSHHILQTWPGQLKLCWKRFHTNGKTKVKIKTEKIHKQKTEENKIVQGRYYNTSQKDVFV